MSGGTSVAAACARLAAAGRGSVRLAHAARLSMVKPAPRPPLRPPPTGDARAITYCIHAHDAARSSFVRFGFLSMVSPGVRRHPAMVMYVESTQPSVADGKK